MRLLLDTHAFLWFVWDDPQLSAPARTAIESSGQEIFLSAASCWEVAIKISIAKLALVEPLEPYLLRHLQLNRIAPLPITITHTGRLAALPLHHRDPFDRMLIAQASVEGMQLVSADAAFDAYSITRLW
jgi:PIN domain nuclease of toxin-antitoxin system